MKENKQIKKNLAIVFGGKTAEHEVSVTSTKNVYRAVDKNKYNIFLIGINKIGEWFFVNEGELLSEKKSFSQEKVSSGNSALPFSKDGDFYIKRGGKEVKIDVVFPLIHGTFGEDGTLQGLFKIFNVPFVGPSVLGSAVGMDKDVAKRLMRDSGIPVSDFVTFKKHQRKEINFEKIKKALGLPLFVKPANLGSSVGISKVRNEKEFNSAIKKAFDYDNKIIIEEFIKGKEIECSVLGNEKLIASVLGEIVPSHDFYSYEAKYLDENGAVMAIPANISKSVAKKIQEMALKVFDVLSCEGMGRVDFFLTEDNKIIVNEINTIPGFTSISMYPKLLEKSGITYSKLIDKLIGLAIQRFKSENKLKNI